MLDKHGFVFGPHVLCVGHRLLVRVGNPFQVVGHVELDETTYILGSFTGPLDMTDVREDFERTITKHKIQR